jgi:hypothetical protein
MKIVIWSHRISNFKYYEHSKTDYWQHYSVVPKARTEVRNSGKNVTANEHGDTSGVSYIRATIKLWLGATPSTESKSKLCLFTIQRLTSQLPERVLCTNHRLQSFGTVVSIVGVLKTFQTWRTRQHFQEKHSKMAVFIPVDQISRTVNEIGKNADDWPLTKKSTEQPS